MGISVACRRRGHETDSFVPSFLENPRSATGCDVAFPGLYVGRKRDGKSSGGHSQSPSVHQGGIHPTESVGPFRADQCPCRSSRSRSTDNEFSLSLAGERHIVNGQTQRTLPAQLLKRGDQVAVEVIPFNGAIEGRRSERFR